MNQLRFSLILFVLFVPFISYAHGVSISDQELLNNGELWSFLYVGAKHMVTGYDHLLFLAGVVFYLNTFKDIVKFISVFTLGHSITLLGATYLGVKADEHLVDAVIALSVLYKGFENLGGFDRLKVKAPHLLFMVFVFGLIHGFGLSTRLQSFDIGVGQFLQKIISFNLGVEIGQILALIPIVFIIKKWREFSSFMAFYKAANMYLVIAGIFLIFYQLRGFFLSA